MKPQIKSFTNGVIFPVVDAILLVVLIVKSVMSGVTYRQGGQFEWHAIAVLAGGLVVSLTAPLWIWAIIHW